MEDLWEEFRGRAAAIDIALLESESTAGAIERLKQEAVQGRPRRRRADRAHRPHRLRRRAPLPRPAPGDLGDRPGAEAVPGRARRREPAPALLDRAPLGGDPQRPRRRPRARARRQRRQPVRDARGRLRRRLRRGRRQRLRGAVEGDREGDLDDRHPRGPRLRAPVLLDRDQARARGDLPDRGVRRLGRGRGWVRGARRRHRRAARGPARRRRRRAKPAKTFRFYPKVYKAAVAAANGSAGYADYSAKVRELEAESPISMRHIIKRPVRSRSDRTGSGRLRASATTTTRS